MDIFRNNRFSGFSNEGKKKRWLILVQYKFKNRIKSLAYGKRIEINEIISLLCFGSRHKFLFIFKSVKMNKDIFKTVQILCYCSSIKMICPLQVKIETNFNDEPKRNFFHFILIWLFRRQQQLRYLSIFIVCIFF